MESAHFPTLTPCEGLRLDLYIVSSLPTTSQSRSTRLGPRLVFFSVLMPVILAGFGDSDLQPELHSIKEYTAGDSDLQPELHSIKEYTAVYLPK